MGCVLTSPLQDTSIISTAIPQITNEFNSLEDVGWYGSAYFLTTCAFQLLWGRCFTFFDLKWTYICAIAFFEVGSLICAVAPSSIALIVGRAIAGVGSAGIFTGSFTIIAFSTPLHKRPIYTGLLSTMYGIASPAGPLIGGVLTDKVSWRWCFYINLPLGGVVVVGILLLFKAPAQNPTLRNLGWKEKLNKLDPFGTVVFITSLVCLLLALQWGGAKYRWDSGRIVALIYSFGWAMTIWIGFQVWRGENATVPGRIVKQRSMIFASFNNWCMGGAFFLLLYYVPIWFQAIKGDSAIKSGIHGLPMVLTMTTVILISGLAISRLGHYAPFMIASSILGSVGSGLMTTWKPTTGAAKWISYEALFGLGIGMGWQQPLLIVQTVLEKKDIPVGTAVMMTWKLLGGAVFVSVGSSVFENRFLNNLATTVPSVNAATVLKAGATELRKVLSPTVIDQVVTAYNGAVTQTFYISVGLCSLAIVGAFGVEWKSVTTKKAPATAATADAAAARRSKG